VHNARQRASTRADKTAGNGTRPRGTFLGVRGPKMRFTAVLVLALALAASAAAQEHKTAPNVASKAAVNGSAPGAAPLKPLNSSAPADKPLAPLGKTDKAPVATLPAGSAADYTVEAGAGCIDAGAAQASTAAFVSGREAEERAPTPTMISSRSHWARCPCQPAPPVHIPSAGSVWLGPSSTTLPLTLSRIHPTTPPPPHP
jgi:hypothetical protein